MDKEKSSFEAASDCRQKKLKNLKSSIIKKIYYLENIEYLVTKARTSNMGGTGFGLAIVKEIIEQFGGEIVIESSEHERNTFRFYFLK